MNGHSVIHRYNAGLSIAGIGLDVCLNREELALQWAERSREFPLDGAGSLQAEFQALVDPAVRSEIDRAVRFQNGRLEFDSPNCQGQIDLAAGRIELSVKTASPLADLEYFMRVVYALLAFEAGGMLFHGAGIIRREKAFVFFGHSGSGKTTVARLSPEDLVLNDDLLLLMPRAEGWMVYATPFWNLTQVRPCPAHAPLGGLYRLVQDRRVFLEPMGAAQALAEVVSNTPVIPDDPGRSLELLQRGWQLLSEVPAHRLHFLPDDSFWPAVEAQAFTELQGSA